MYLKAGDERKAEPPPAPAIQGDITKDRYSKGAMTAFVIKPSRPPLAEVSFSDEQGKPLSLSQWKGRVVLLNLWATWCAPCRKEMPSLAVLQREIGSKDFEVVAVSLDRKGVEASKSFLTEVGATGLALYVDSTADTLDKVQASGLPATVLIDRQGREIGRLLGPAEWNSAEAKALIAAAVAEK